MSQTKIKKKGVLIPFRQTMAYRIMLLALSILFFLFTLWEMTLSLAANNTLAFIMAAVIGVVAAFTVFYNLDHLREGRISPQAAKRMKRR